MVFLIPEQESDPGSDCNFTAFTTVTINPTQTTVSPVATQITSTNAGTKTVPTLPVLMYVLMITTVML